MLIKLYTQNYDLIIIEGVTNVSVPSGCIGYNPKFGQPDDGYAQIVFDEFPADGEYTAREIRYSDDGPCRVLVFNKAYICNDDGKTIEKVVAGPQVV